MEHFISSFKLLYGAHNISSNVHQAEHLISYIKKFGPIQHFSAFIYENHMQTFKKLLRQPNQPLQQIVRRCAEQEKNRSVLAPLIPQTIEFSLNIESIHTDGPLLFGCIDPQYKVIKSSSMSLRARSCADSCCSLNDRTIILIQNIAYCSQRKIPVIIGNEFLRKENLFSVPCDSAISVSFWFIICRS